MRTFSPRLRLPRGFCRLRPDFGEVIRARRRDGYGTQAEVAKRSGIARETLSRIEQGHRPAYASTFDGLLLALDLDWDAIAAPGPTSRPARVFNDTFRGDAIYELGRSLRLARRSLGLSLQEAAERSGVSPSQLSRIERGEAGRSHAFADHPEDGNRPVDQRRMVFTDPFLASLVDGLEERASA